MAPADAVEGVLDDAAAAGVRNVIVLASGYREVGDQGRAQEDRLIARAAGHGITLLGPNCLGFVNAHARAAPFALTVPPSLLAGPVGIALQSGALGGVVLAFAHAHAIGVSTLATMGNEAMIATTDVLEYLVEDDATRVICLFLEQISDPVRFAGGGRTRRPRGQADRRAQGGREPGGPAGRARAHRRGRGRRRRGRRGAAPAQRDPRDQPRGAAVHRGAARLRPASRWPAHGGGHHVGRRVRPHRRPRHGRGDRDPAVRAQTEAAITPHVPPFAAVRNPIDVTGYFLANRRTVGAHRGRPRARRRRRRPGPGLRPVHRADPAGRPAGRRGGRRGCSRERAAWLGERIASAPVPVIPVGHTCVNLSRYGRELLGASGVHLLRRHRPRHDRARPCAALAGEPGGPRRQARGVHRDAGRAGDRDAGDAGLVRSAGPGAGAADPGEPWSEAAARDLLASSGVPVVPGELVNSADDAAAAARRLGLPVVLKVCSAQIAHKSDIGGVAVGPRHRGRDPRRLRAGAAPLARRFPGPGSTASWSARCAPAEWS